MDNQRPASATVQWICFTGFAMGVATFFFLKFLQLPPLHVVVGCMLTLAVSIGVLDLLVLKVHRRPDSGLDFTRPARTSLSRVLVKLLGFFATLGIIALSYWVLPEYRGSFYNPLWQMLGFYWPYLVFLIVGYFFYLDGRMQEPRDGYWQVGNLVLGRWQYSHWPGLRQYALGWLVKAFFFPLMFVYLANDFSWLLKFSPGKLTSISAYYDFVFRLTFAVDVAFAALGYLMTIRLFGAHIRSTEPTLLGWSVAIVCYQPLWSAFSTHYLTYQDNYAWGPWLSDIPVMMIVWAVSISLLNLVYLWATITFGLRFSNLTHRGILTNGPYRFSKHPAYIAKNLSWWLIAVPFLPVHGWDMALRQCLMLFGLNVIYYLRAITEERHLSWDKTYVAYAEWMNDHGIFARLGKRLPFFRYRKKRPVISFE